MAQETEEPGTDSSYARLLQDCRDVFLQYDPEQPDWLDVKHVGNALRKLKTNPTDSEVRAIIKKHGERDRKDGPKRMSMANFVETVRHLLSKNPEKELLEAFRSLDKEGHGYITATRFKQIFAGSGSSEEELDELVIRADSDGDGMIDFEEFVAVMMDKDN